MAPSRPRPTALHRVTSPVRALLRRLIAAWVETRRIEPAPETLGLDPGLPVLYVLPAPALSDALLLEALCPVRGLPPATGRRRVGALAVGATLALPAPRRRWQRAAPVATPLRDLLAQRHADAGSDVQLVPVSVFWGRAPGKRFGFWHLLAADSWALTGRLRRALSVLVNGKNVEVHFGAPLKLGDMLDARGEAAAERKTARLLRVHFRRVRSQVLGPDLSHRRTLIEGVATSPEVRRVIDDLARREGMSAARLETRARRYGREIAANMAYPVLRFLDGLLQRLWRRLYDDITVRGLDRVKGLAGDHTLVYVPCHRSHIDYLLLSHRLFAECLMPPHIAAGRNLDMPVIGPLLRRAGAFFLRRSFRDNPLYGAVFNEYLHRLLARGHPLAYFIEGGRSRSGRQLPAKPGMLAMTLRSFLRSAAGGGRPRLAFVPVYIGYERILESASYQRELHGGDKRKETPLALLRLRRQLRGPFGEVVMNVGEPLLLEGYLEREIGDWRTTLDTAGTNWPERLVPRLGEALNRRINAAAALNPVNLVALVLLATPSRALEASLLERQVGLLARLPGCLPDDGRVSLPEGQPATWIDRAVRLGMVTYRSHPLGDIVLADAAQAGPLAWYRNNVLHLFALPGLAAFAFRHRAHHDLAALESLLAPVWPILTRELTTEPPASLREALAEVLERLVEEGLLVREDDGWRRPEEALTAGEQLRLLGQLMQPSLERSYLLLAVLLDAGSGQLDADALAQQSRRLAERLALLSGLDAPEFFDTELFSGLVTSLEAQGWLWQDHGRLAFDARLPAAARRSRALFDPALRHRLQLVTRYRDE